MSDDLGALPPDLIEALQGYPATASAPFGLTASRIATGLLHQTWAVETDEGRFIAQRVHPIFAPEIHENIAAVANHLASKGLETLQLCPTVSGAHFMDTPSGARWRLCRRLPGVTFDHCQGPQQARAAGAAVAAFHSALVDFEAPLAPLGFPFHQTDQHFQDLRESLEEYSGHPFHTSVRELARKIEVGLNQHRPPSDLRPRVVHGDLKLSNLLFSGLEPPACDEVVALIDLDTLSRLPLYFDLGDALRSWSNQRPEDTLEASLNLPIFMASVEGYRSGIDFPLDPAEKKSLEGALEIVTLELCMRYATDTLKESYFAWDSDRYESSAEHNWARAAGQWSLYEQAVETASERRVVFRDWP